MASGKSNNPEKPFQSTPAITGGRDAIDLVARLDQHQVSIHARHYWRARLSWAARPLAVLMFQSTPAITGGRDWRQPHAALQRNRFQSTPAITGGRDALAVWSRCTAPGFNPRPPLLAGETPARSSRPTSLSLFQSTPAITGGRDGVPFFVRPGAGSFQSTPAITGGRDPGRGAGQRWPERVSIHARHYWRARQCNK